MKKAIFSMAVLIAIGTSLIHAQRFQLRGLEIYNPYYHNPAYVMADKNVQIDFIGYNFPWYSGIWTSAMTTIPKYNSSAGIRFAQGTNGEALDVWNLQLAYAYNHSFSEDLHLNGGLLFSSGHLEFADAVYEPDQEVLKTRRNGSLGLGVSLEYKKLHTGLSTHLPLYVRRDVLVGDNVTETQKDKAENITFNFLAGYSLGKPGRLTFDPIFGLDYYFLNGGQIKELKGYLGGNMKIRNLVGFGFTMGNLVSFSTSLNIMDRVTLMLGIYAGEHELFGPMDNTNYIIGSNDFDIIGQIRINL